VIASGPTTNQLMQRWPLTCALGTRKANSGQRECEQTAYQHIIVAIESTSLGIRWSVVSQTHNPSKCRIACASTVVSYAHSS
jgi:hypothetical protein